LQGSSKSARYLLKRQTDALSRARKAYTHALAFKLGKIVQAIVSYGSRDELFRLIFAASNCRRDRGWSSAAVYPKSVRCLSGEIDV
jgi:hypothetical protein